jgi:hypothetical protein
MAFVVGLEERYICIILNLPFCVLSKEAGFTLTICRGRNSLKIQTMIVSEKSQPYYRAESHSLASILYADCHRDSTWISIY